MTWVMHVPGERVGAIQRCSVCAFVLQDVSLPPGLQVPDAEVEATAQQVPWWTVGQEVIVDGNATADLSCIAAEHVPPWHPCTAAAP